MKAKIAKCFPGGAIVYVVDRKRIQTIKNNQVQDPDGVICSLGLNHTKETVVLFS